jgi:hypothetical protein
MSNDFYEKIIPLKRGRGRPRKDSVKVSPIWEFGRRSTEIEPAQRYADVMGFCQNIREGRDLPGSPFRVVRDLLKGKGSWEIVRVTNVDRACNIVGYIEILERNPETARKEATYLYEAFVKDPYDTRGAGAQLRSEQGELYRRGLFIPLNFPELLDAERAHKVAVREAEATGKEPTSVPRPIAFAYEGASATNIGGRSLIHDPAVMAFMDEMNIGDICLTGWLGGRSGATNTNWIGKPVEDYHDDVVHQFSCLDCTSFDWYLIRDNDVDGIVEAEQVGDFLLSNAKVPVTQIHIVDPPRGVISGWDDADRLPLGMTRLDRFKSILASPLFSERWLLDEKDRIDWKEVPNRKRAIKECQVKVQLDYGTGDLVVTDSGHTVELTETKTRDIAERALRLMGSSGAYDRVLPRDWKSHFTSIGEDNPIDTIDMEDPKDNRTRVTSAPTAVAEVLFPMTFGVPNTPYYRECGRVVIRDLVALAKRNAFGADPVKLQWALMLIGDQGDGKSLFGKVLSGGKPGPEDYHRFADNIDFNLFQDDGNKMLKALWQKAKGKTVLEFADKSLGEKVGPSLSGKLNNIVNLSSIPYRMFWSDFPLRYNRRFIMIFTCNPTNSLSLLQKGRRWPVIDIRKSNHGSLKDWQESIKKRCVKDDELSDEERLVSKGFNPGLNWLYNHRGAILADMLGRDDWKGDLNLPPELLTMMDEEQSEHISVENSLEAFGYLLDEFERSPGIGIHAKSITTYFSVKDRGITANKYSDFLRARKGEDGSIWRNKTMRLKEYEGDAETRPMKIWYYSRDEIDKCLVFAVMAKPFGYNDVTHTFESAPLGKRRGGLESDTVDGGVGGEIG